MKMIIIVGGANQLGEKIVQSLNDKNEKNIIIADTINDRNWHYLKKAQISDLISLEDLPCFLESHKKQVTILINLHCRLPNSSHSVNDYLKDNFRLPLDLYHWCCRHRIRLMNLVHLWDNGFPEYTWSTTLLNNSIQQIATMSDREYPSPPQYVRVMIGQLLGGEDKVEQSLAQSLDTAIETPHAFTPIENCHRVFLWLIRTPSISGEINLAERPALSQIKKVLAESKEAIQTTIPTQQTYLTDLGFDEKLISIEEFLSELIQK